MRYEDENFSILNGKTLKSATNNGNEIVFATTDGEEFKLFHSQDCCESVHVEDVCGDLEDLVGSPILLAEMTSTDENPNGNPSEDLYGGDEQWTFYKLSTIKGHVTIRWYGSSNGYYSISVNFVRMVRS